MESTINVNMSEDWLNDKLGVSFDSYFWSDPIKRTENKRQLAYEMHNKFGDIGMGECNPVPEPIASDEYSHRFMSKLFGCDIVYSPNQAPGVIHKNYDFDQLAKLEIPDLHNNDIIKKALSDAKILNSKYGYCYGGINMGSPLNVAVTVFGENFLACCALEPDIARHVLMIIARTEIRLMYELCQIIEPKAFPNHPFSFGYGNCPAIMVSPITYKKVILPVDLWVRSQCDNFALHHCGIFDKYAELYTELKPTALDIGGGSDYTIVRKHFPTALTSYIVNAEYIEGKSQEEIDSEVRKIVTQGGPKEYISILWCADLSCNTTIDNIRDLKTSIIRQNLY